MKTDYIPPDEMDLVLRLLTFENRMAMIVAIHTGLRISDVLELKKPPTRQRWITEKKTGKRRRVNLTDALIRELEKIPNAGSPYIFPGSRDPKKHRTRQAVWADIKRAARALRLPDNLGTHSGRKTYAVNEFKETGNTETVQKKLGHNSETTTMIYILAEAAYRQRHEKPRPRRARRRRRRKKPTL